jgi:hypothetical protein
MCSSQYARYIDLQNNQLSIEAMAAIGAGVASLNLSMNPLKSCKLPLLQTLRTLYLDDCGITTFESLPRFPNLCLLSMANNRLTTFKGLPILSALESVILSGNSVDFPRILVIQAIGSIRIISINNTPVTAEELETAFQLSPLVGYALRTGRNPALAADELAESQLHLTSSLRRHFESTGKTCDVKSLTLCDDSSEPTATLPLEGTDMAWFMNSIDAEWTPIPKTKRLRTIPITMMMRLRLLRCDFSIAGNRFSLYSDRPIGLKPGELSLPSPINPVVAGTAIEGSVVSLFPLPIPARVAWIREADTIAQDVPSITLSKADVNHAIACLLQPYCPDFPGVVFSTILQATEIVAPLLPVVTGIVFPEHLIEGVRIEFHRTFLPNREGESQVTIERAIAPSSEWVIAAKLDRQKLQYTPTSLDAGHFLRICYTPVTDAAVAGPVCHFYSDSRALPGFPTFSNPVIGGRLMTGYPLVAVADYSGGRQGKCSYNWYFSRSPINAARGLSSRLQSVATKTRCFTPTQDHADGYIACQMIPVRADDAIGPPVFCAAPDPIQLTDPPKPIPNCPTDPIVGRPLRFPFEVDFLLSLSSGRLGFEDVRSGSSFTPRDKHVGRVLRVISEGYDAVVGEIRAATPVIVQIEVTANRWVVGECASICITHKYVDPDKIEIVWLRCSDHLVTVIAIDTPEYVLTIDEADFSIEVVATPLDVLRNKLVSCHSNRSPTIRRNDLLAPTLTGTFVEDTQVAFECPVDVQSVQWFRGARPVSTDRIYTLTNKDVGWQIRAELRLSKSGIVVAAASSCLVKPCDPRVDLSFGDQPPTEGDLLRPNVVWHGGTEGKSIIHWHREKGDDWEHVGDGLQYQTGLDDVDLFLRVTYQPVRSDGVIGPESQLDIGPVESRDPRVRNVTINQNSHGSLEVSADYSGGVEGFSFIVWRAYDERGEPVNLGKSIGKDMAVTHELIGKVVDCVYVPVRTDGLAGRPTPSSNKVKVRASPSVEAAELLVKGGVLKVGSEMHCRATCSKGAAPTFQWQRGDGHVWEVIAGETGVELVPTTNDVGFIIQCSVVAVDKRGWVSTPMAVTTCEPVAPAKAALEICCQGDAFVTGTTLTTNVPSDRVSDAHLQWQREVNGEWQDVADRPEYLLTADDVGKRVRVVGDGERRSLPTKVIEFAMPVVAHSRSMTRASIVKFKAKEPLAEGAWTVTGNAAGLTMKSKTGTLGPAKWRAVRCECVPGTSDEMVLWTDPCSKFVIVPDISDDPRMLAALGEQNVRDYVVATIRGFVELFKK